MGIWIGTVTVEHREGAVLFDSVTMRPIGLPLFDSEEEADTFLAYAYSLEFDDVRAMSQESLDRLHTEWCRAGKPGGGPKLVRADREARKLIKRTAANDR